MSTATPLPNKSVAPASQILRTAAKPFQAAAFWTAIAVPMAYPALLYGGLPASQVPLLVAVIAINVVALVLGRGHNVEE